MTAHDDPLAPFVPSEREPFDLAKAGHLLRRVALGASLRERRRAVASGLTATLAELAGDEALAAPEPTLAHLEDVVALGEIERVRAWRFLGLLRSPARLRVRMSLFWHQHFATSDQKVRSAELMARQQATFDAKGLGPFEELLLAASQEPAMLRWLDAESSKKGLPNENFARELFELFALGRGKYGERDVQEAARAFTGWQIHDGAFRDFAPWHDRGEKVVLGRRGAFRGEDVVRLVAREPACARFLARKLLAAFVHPEPEEREVQALADVWQREGGHVGRTLRVLFGSRLFFSPRAYRARVASPVEFTVTLVRSLGARVAPAALARAAAALGQTLLEPPSVEGWAEDRAWLSSATWLLRQNFVADLFANRRGFHLQPAPDLLFTTAKAAAARADLALLLLLDGHVDAAARAKVATLAAAPEAAGPGGTATLLQAILALPEAHLV